MCLITNNTKLHSIITQNMVITFLCCNIMTLIINITKIILTHFQIKSNDKIHKLPPKYLCSKNQTINKIKE